MAALRAILGNGSDHVLRLAADLEPQRALEYLAGAGAARPPHYAALDREWLETVEGRWIRRSAIVELQLVNDDRPRATGSAPRA